MHYSQPRKALHLIHLIFNTYLYREQTEEHHCVNWLIFRTWGQFSYLKLVLVKLRVEVGRRWARVQRNTGAGRRRVFELWQWSHNIAGQGHADGEDMEWNLSLNETFKSVLQQLAYYSPLLGQGPSQNDATSFRMESQLLVGLFSVVRLASCWSVFFQWLSQTNVH